MTETLSKRQKAILEIVTQNGYAATEDMVSEFQVAPQTIRRDLNELHKCGLITRFHGGAGAPQEKGNRPYKDRASSRIDEKRKIARLTTSLIPDGSTLFLNSGTTMEAVAKELLVRQDLSVVTNNIKVADILSENSSFRILLAGGQLRNTDGALTGSATLHFIEQFHMDFGLIGTNSIDENGVFWDYDQYEVELARAVLSHSEKTILIADKHKFGRRAMNRVESLDKVDALVTDKEPNDAFSNILKTHNVDVHSVKAS